MSNQNPQNMTTRDVLALLADMERRSRESVDNIPDVANQPDIVQCLAYQISGVDVVSPMSDISEMFAYPEQLNKVPSVKSWMLGLANVRGNLLPIVDLQVFLGGEPVPKNVKSRVLVLNRNGLLTAVLVPAVFGMRHFHVSQKTDRVKVDGLQANLVTEAFETDDKVWPVFNLDLLTADPAFRVAAA